MFCVYRYTYILLNFFDEINNKNYLICINPSILNSLAVDLIIGRKSIKQHSLILKMPSHFFNQEDIDLLMPIMTVWSLRNKSNGNVVNVSDGPMREPTQVISKCNSLNDNLNTKIYNKTEHLQKELNISKSKLSNTDLELVVKCDNGGCGCHSQAGSCNPGLTGSPT